MKRKIEISVDVPEGIDPEIIDMLLRLSDSELNMIKGILIGIHTAHEMKDLAAEFPEKK